MPIPEDTSIWGTVFGEYAGERIVAYGLDAYANNNEDVRSSMLEKRVCDDEMKTWGYHINMSADLSPLPGPKALRRIHAQCTRLSLHNGYE